MSATRIHREHLALQANRIGKPDEQWTVFPRLTWRSKAHTLAAWLRALDCAEGRAHDPRAAYPDTAGPLWEAIEIVTTRYGDY